MVSVTLHNYKLNEAKDHEKKVNNCVLHLNKKYNTAYQYMQDIGINMTIAIEKLEKLKFKKDKNTRLLYSNSSKPKNNKKLVQSKLDKVNVDLQIETDYVIHITNKYNFACWQVQDIYIKICYALKSSYLAVIIRKEIEKDMLK
jgi:hypothetical protein